MSELPNGWVETTLEGVMKNVSRRFDFSDKDKVVFVNTGDVLEGNFLHNNYISAEGLPGQAKKAIEKGDILYSEIRPKNKRYALVDFQSKDYVVSTKFMVLKRNSNVDLNYLYLSLTSHNMLRVFNANAEARSGTFPQITFDSISDIEINLPPLDEQKSIADILVSFDDKIELLRAQNKTLETLAQTLFKEWFVKFNFPNATGEMINSELGQIPKGWQVGKLEDIVLNIKKSLKKGDDLKGRKYIPIDEMPMRKLGLDSSKPIGDAQSSLIGFEPGDILFGAMRCYFHRVCFSTIKGVTRATAMVLRVKNELFFEFSLLLINQNSSVDYANQNSKGTTMPYAVWQGSFANMSIIIPSEDIAIKFSNLTSPLLAKIQKNISQAQILEKTRDALLPKLMSGNIRVDT
ncbi:Type I restriction-modification system, specificity subunit S [Bathymodiolus heckerae thiotrophic gill symbiont]|uniref:restriction endonuclease subunit S n=1 Tax=Bathymodiolus heckerae thiotrophic gill symbiont TaxID=1052212 RepID=UPI0010B3B370|nr:restriction endonuclease subunit S [Bathymodiolus heckerae thiotrophic gill symbiont]CAC9590391.1 Type I restriction-modification system, specificity subunit S [uncultured Gammaproteobacteria bacterium]SHN93107.1 Type I restriction-modification system, specificity subunit S [Bathymodiolus heckerae thiotrophic gill symbiont]